MTRGDKALSQAASLDDWLTTDEVANQYGVTPLAVTRMISKGRLRATKKGWQLLVHVSDLPKSWPPAPASVDA